MKRILIALVAISSFIISCKDKSDTGTTVERSTSDSVELASLRRDSLQKAKAVQDSIDFARKKDSILLKLTQTILTNLKNRHYAAFANYIHPVDGIRFSPYGYVDTIRHIKFSRASFIAQSNKADSEMIVWGEFDGTGDPIKMTLNNYIRRFVYDVDFAKPEKLEVNEFIGSGNSLNNLLSVYKDCNFTESHFSGFDEKYQGMDWKSLRLVFKERNKRFFLVGIVHDEWTI
ncbi:MAG TPA: hypothetical protein VF144_02040 [Chitinophagaceae bacterium]